MNRREYLILTGVTSSVGLAGCLGSEGNNGASDDGNDSETSASISLDSEPSSCPPQSRSGVGAMPGVPDGYTAQDSRFFEDGEEIGKDGETYYADGVKVWYDGPDGGTHLLRIYIWESPSVAEADDILSNQAVLYKGDEEYEMSTGLKARVEHLTLVIWADSGEQSSVETLYESIACVDQSQIISTTWDE